MQLLEEAVALAGDFISGLIEAATRADDPLAAVDAFFALWRGRLLGRDFRSGCPIVAVIAPLGGAAAEIHDLLVNALRTRPAADTPPA